MRLRNAAPKPVEYVLRSMRLYVAGIHPDVVGGRKNDDRIELKERGELQARFGGLT